MTVSTHLGFKFEYRMSNASPTYQDFVVADTAFHEGDTVNLESGQVDLGVSGQTTFIGVVTTTKSGMTAGTTTIQVLRDADAVYSVYDANARLAGATLDMDDGATGAQGVTGSSNKEFVVVETSTATERTLVKWNVGAHIDNVAL